MCRSTAFAVVLYILEQAWMRYLLLKGVWCVLVLDANYAHLNAFFFGVEVFGALMDFYGFSIDSSVVA